VGAAFLLLKLFLAAISGLRASSGFASPIPVPGCLKEGSVGGFGTRLPSWDGSRGFRSVL
jgi:hypothetical protein